MIQYQESSFSVPEIKPSAGLLKKQTVLMTEVSTYHLDCPETFSLTIATILSK